LKDNTINHRISLLRMLLLFGGITLLMTGWLIQLTIEDHADPLIYRVFFFAACLTIFVFSYHSKFVIRHFILLINVLIVFYLVWLSFITYLNNLDTTTALMNYLSLIGICLTFSNPRNLIYFLMLYFAGFTPVVLLIENPEMQPVVFLSLFYASGILGFITLKYFFQIQNRLLNINSDFQILVDSIEESIFMISKGYKVLKTNKNGIESINRFFNRRISEGDSILDFLFEDQKEKFQKSFNAALNGKILSLERKLITKNDEVIWFEFKYIPVRNTHGEITAILFSALDITEKKTSSEILKNSENKFRTIFLEAPVCMAIVTLEGQLSQINFSFTETLGYSEEDIKNIQLSEIISENIRSEVEAQIQLLTTEKIEEFRNEISYQRKDGKIIHTLTRLTLITNMEKTDFLLAQIVDIDQLKKSEEALKEKNIELEKANEELDKFVYSAAHDLRAPLTSVLGLINLLRNEKEVEKNSYIDLIEKSVVKLDFFIKDVIDYSRNSRLGLSVQPVNLETIIRKAYENHLYLNGKSKISISIEMEGNGAFYSDKGRMEIIFNNIISNAIKYHDHKKPNPYIQVKGKIEKNAVGLEITDNGIGIAPENLDKIFNIFYRGHEESKGSGLGLYIVKETVEKLKGVIQVESIPEIGTTFKIRLPNENLTGNN